MPSSHPTIGEKIRHFREQRGWTLSELGERSGINFRLISTWERREADPDFAQTSRLAKALRVSVERLWNAKPAPKS